MEAEKGENTGDNVRELNLIILTVQHTVYPNHLKSGKDILKSKLEQPQT